MDASGLPAHGPFLPRRTVLGAASGASLGIVSLVLPSGAAAASVAATAYTTVASGGKIHGWGPYYGEPHLGTGVTADLRTPRLLTGGSVDYDAAEIVKVAPGDYVGIALAADGTMFSWGDGSRGTLGSGATSDRSGPQTIASWTSDGSTVVATPTIVDFSASNRAIAAVADDGEIYAWGYQYRGEVGLPDSSYYLTPRRTTATLDLSATVGTADRIVQVAASRNRAIWLDGEGVVRTSGNQDNFSLGQLGQGSTAALSSPTAVQIGGDLAGTDGTAARIIQVVAGQYFGLALGRDGAVYSWGTNGSGQLGLGDTTARGAPVALPRTGSAGDLPLLTTTAQRIVQVSAGGAHCLALSLDGRVYAWGAAGNGRLGNGTTTPNLSVPTEITGSGDLPAAGAAGRIVQVVAGNVASYALGADGSVYAWGTGDRYRLGNNADADVSTPVRIWDKGSLAALAPYSGATSTRIVAISTHRGGGEHEHVYALDDSFSA